ncbi:hypothetical protein K493DRAFT_337576 [Basidiobolus meristosporus CBS 931.73]|uniref:C3H1-type domain-containing protein n=1 Tax=Basidiobolus meristosporus CBS 931.73 TaxID=1314790 RepID=A0A1Y1YAB4_9FUNG|nr:hypothetical protein K493DRAFT_337576 [Basidiobolus meristosporus CBS 931.73]|eukprot:ORX94959.1 hypothetical protein K493DRAFT_337576 [Basidiobolus meristosporus CBS 931.73]
MCRTYSELVVESANYLTQGKKKDDLIKEYIRRLAEIPCLYFAKSPPSNRHCPFGDACYYQHLDENGSIYSFTVRARERARRLSTYNRPYNTVTQPSQSHTQPRHEESSIFSSFTSFFSSPQQPSPALTETNGPEEERLPDVQNRELSDSTMIFLMTMTDL